MWYRRFISRGINQASGTESANPIRCGNFPINQSIPTLSQPPQFFGFSVGLVSVSSCMRSIVTARGSGTK
jgi:hypothetical protein